MLIHLNGPRYPWDDLRLLRYARYKPQSIAIQSAVVPPEYWEPGVGVLLFAKTGRRNMLIEKGVLKSFIYDLKTAAQSGVESTGNASRGLFNPPEPSFTNFVIQPGQTPLKDILAGMDEGILVEDLLGIGQGNIISGAFYNPLALAFKIEKGEIVGRVKDLSIAGNVYDLLKNVAAVSKEAHWVYSTFHAPYILISEMSVAGKV